MRIVKNINRKKKVRHSWIKSGSGIQRCAVCGISRRSEWRGRKDRELCVFIIR